MEIAARAVRTDEALADADDTDDPAAQRNRPPRELGDELVKPLDLRHMLGRGGGRDAMSGVSVGALELPRDLVGPGRDKLASVGMRTGWPLGDLVDVDSVVDTMMS